MIYFNQLWSDSFTNEEPTRSCLAPNRLRRSFRLISIMTLVLRNDVITLYLSFEKASAEKSLPTASTPTKPNQYTGWALWEYNALIKHDLP